VTVIKVPKTPKSAFNQQRPASTLLQAQIAHLEAAVGVNQPARKAPQRRRKTRTEGEAAAYIERLMKQLHPQPDRGAAIAEPPLPPASAGAPRAKKRRRARPGRRTRRRRSGR
jgi:hypothetical protein